MNLDQGDAMDALSSMDGKSVEATIGPLPYDRLA